MDYDPDVWGPHYWFVLFTIAVTYPVIATEKDKKHYYNFIQDFPMFLPGEPYSNKFADMINKYPVTPYLDSRESMIQWVHFIHNRFNVLLGKKAITLEDALYEYNLNYRKPASYYSDIRVNYNVIVTFIIIAVCIASIKLYT